MWFKKKKPELVTFHPVRKIPIKYEFECDGKHYYKAVNDYEVPKRRFGFAKKFYEEMQSKVTTETLQEFCKKGKELCAIKDGQIDVGLIYKLFDELDYRTKWVFEPESLMRFASVVYFDLEENIDDYDFEYNKIKIASFEKKNFLQRFIMMLFNGQKILSDLSEASLTAYLYDLQCHMERQKKLISSETQATNSK